MGFEKKKVYHWESNSMKMMGYLQLNVIDDYNSHTNQTDIADQLRGQYRLDDWMRHKNGGGQFLSGRLE